MELEDFSIEDIVEIVVGQQQQLGAFALLPKDKSVLGSMGKQTAKGTSLTDLQYKLLYTILVQDHYIAQFEHRGFTKETYLAVLSNTRTELRDVDRSKTMTVTYEIPSIRNRWTAASGTAETVTKDSPWIKLSFPFNKKHLVSVNEFSKLTSNYVHLTSSRDHYFKIDERVVYELVKEFQYKGYTIDKELIEFYNEIKHVAKNPTEYQPTVKNGELVNFHPATEKWLLDHYGVPSQDTAVRYKDHSIQFDIANIDEALLSDASETLSALSKSLINRKSVQVLVRPDDWLQTDIVHSLVELERLPVLVILDTDDCLRDLRTSFERFNQYVDRSEVSVLFRVSNEVNPAFNTFVKEHKINNPVTEKTKVVYICKDKLPKPLLKSEWMPESVVRIGSTRLQTKIDQWICDCDMVIHYDKVASPWSPSSYTYMSYQSEKRKIEKI